MENGSFEQAAFNPQEETHQANKNWRDRFVTPLLIGSLILGIFALIPALNGNGSAAIKALYITSYTLIGIVAVIRFPYSIRIGVFLFSIYALGLGELVSRGILGDALFFFLSLVVLAAILLSPRAGMITIIIDILTFIVFGWLMLTGRMTTVTATAAPAQLTDWVSSSALIIIFGMLIVVIFQRLETAFLEAQTQIDTTLATLQNERNNLENNVVERTQQMQKVNQIGRDLTTILDPIELLERAVYLISESFDCYYTAIFLIDNTGQWAELRAATGDAGKVLRENKHHLEINGKSSVGITIRTRLARITQGSESEATRFDNPLLPYTRSQIVLPLTTNDLILGALEMHSTKEKAFSQQEVRAYQDMASQITIALENSRLFSEEQQSLSEMSAAQQQYLQGAWLTLESNQKLEYEVGDSEASGNPQIEVPLSLREQIIGRINMASAGEWTTEQKNLIESIAAQAALALENARLVEESQSIAARERLVNDITSKVWASATVDGILQTAVRELGRVLEAAEVDIEVSMSEINE